MPRAYNAFTWSRPSSRRDLPLRPSGPASYYSSATRLSEASSSSAVPPPRLAIHRHDRGRSRASTTPAASQPRARGPALFKRYLETRDPAAREALVERFLPLARQLARRYQRAEEPLDDLIQVASLGLVKAIDRFDAEREVAFSSYAVPTILGEIKRHFRDRTWSVRVPRDLQELSLKVDRTVVAMRRPAAPADRRRARGEAGRRRGGVLEAMEASGAYRATSLSAPRGGEDAGRHACRHGRDRGARLRAPRTARRSTG